VKTRLCKACESLHYKKQPKAKHQTFSINSYLFVEQPQDFDAFLERDRNVKQVLSAIDNAELRLGEECERVSLELESEEARIVQIVKETLENGRSELTRLYNATLSRLAELKIKVKSTLRSRLLNNNDSVHRLVQDPAAVWPFLNDFNLFARFNSEGLGKVLEDYCQCYATGDQKADLRAGEELFWSDVDSVPRLFTLNLSLRTVGIFNPERHSLCQHLISDSVSLYEYSSWCLAEGSQLAICGGYNEQKGRCTRSAILLNPLTTAVSKLPQMLQSRRRGGLLYYNHYLIMFGGYSSDYLSQVEQYDFTGKTWAKVGNMNEQRSAICPVVNNEKVLLAGDGSKSIESFCLLTRQFTTLKVQMVYDCWPTLFIHNEQIMVLQRGKLVTLTDRGYGHYGKQEVEIAVDNWWYSQSQPVLRASKFYFLRYK
jgi:hypothetical protein